MHDGNDSIFPRTTWTMILGAAGPNETCDQKKLGAFCRTYRQPVVRFLMRIGNPQPDAEELAQEFFRKLIADDLLGRVDRERTKRFRIFLKTALSNFTIDQYRKRKARGAEVTFSADAAAATGRPVPEQIDDLTPDRLFDRKWALHLLAQAMATLDARYRRPDDPAREPKRDFIARRYSELRAFLQVDQVPASDYAQIAAKLAVSVDSLSPPRTRLCEELATVLYGAVEMTLRNPTREEVLDEMHELLGYIRGDRR